MTDAPHPDLEQEGIAWRDQMVGTRARQLIITDIDVPQPDGPGDPDDQQTLVRALLYANDIEIAGIVVKPTDGALSETHRILDAYGEVQARLREHDPLFPDARELRSLVVQGQESDGLASVRLDVPLSDGAALILSVLDDDDPRPVWVTVWGWTNSLARALLQIRETRTPDELARAVRKLRVYAISDQDDSGPWLRREFPDLFYVVQPAGVPADPQTYFPAAWIGMSIGGPHQETMSREWISENIQSQGPLGAVYPDSLYITEGDTPSWMGLVPNGLAWSWNPGWGGWGGRYERAVPIVNGVAEERAAWTETDRTSDTLDGESSTMLTVSRWRDAYQRDFQNRLAWSLLPPEEVTPEPCVVVDGVPGVDPVFANLRVGGSLILDVSVTPSRESKTILEYQLYPEHQPGPALSFEPLPSGVRITRDAEGEAHLLVQATAFGPGVPVTRYRRIVVS